MQVRTQIRKAFTSMGFEEMPTNNYVESRYATIETDRMLTCRLLQVPLVYT